MSRTDSSVDSRLAVGSKNSSSGGARTRPRSYSNDSMTTAATTTTTTTTTPTSPATITTSSSTPLSSPCWSSSLASTGSSSPISTTTSWGYPRTPNSAFSSNYPPSVYSPNSYYPSSPISSTGHYNYYGHSSTTPFASYSKTSPPPSSSIVTPEGWRSDYCAPSRGTSTQQPQPQPQPQQSPSLTHHYQPPTPNTARTFDTWVTTTTNSSASSLALNQIVGESNQTWVSTMMHPYGSGTNKTYTSLDSSTTKMTTTTKHGSPHKLQRRGGGGELGEKDREILLKGGWSRDRLAQFDPQYTVTPIELSKSYSSASSSTSKRYHEHPSHSKGGGRSYSDARFTDEEEGLVQDGFDSFCGAHYIHHSNSPHPHSSPETSPRISKKSRSFQDDTFNNSSGESPTSSSPRSAFKGLGQKASKFSLRSLASAISLQTTSSATGAVASTNTSPSTRSPPRLGSASTSSTTTPRIGGSYSYPSPPVSPILNSSTSLSSLRKTSTTNSINSNPTTANSGISCLVGTTSNSGGKLPMPSSTMIEVPMPPDPLDAPHLWSEQQLPGAVRGKAAKILGEVTVPTGKAARLLGTERLSSQVARRKVEEKKKVGRIKGLRIGLESFDEDEDEDEEDLDNQGYDDQDIDDDDDEDESGYGEGEFGEHYNRSRSAPKKDLFVKGEAPLPWGSGRPARTIGQQQGQGEAMTNSQPRTSSESTKSSAAASTTASVPSTNQAQRYSAASFVDSTYHQSWIFRPSSSASSSYKHSNRYDNDDDDQMHGNDDRDPNRSIRYPYSKNKGSRVSVTPSFDSINLPSIRSSIASGFTTSIGGKGGCGGNPPLSIRTMGTRSSGSLNSRERSRTVSSASSRSEAHFPESPGEEEEEGEGEGEIGSTQGFSNRSESIQMTFSPVEEDDAPNSTCIDSDMDPSTPTFARIKRSESSTNSMLVPRSSDRVTSVRRSFSAPLYDPPATPLPPIPSLNDRGLDDGFALDSVSASKGTRSSIGDTGKLASRFGTAASVQRVHALEALEGRRKGSTTGSLKRHKSLTRHVSSRDGGGGGGGGAKLQNLNLKKKMAQMTLTTQSGSNTTRESKPFLELSDSEEEDEEEGLDKGLFDEGGVDDDDDAPLAGLGGIRTTLPLNFRTSVLVAREPTVDLFSPTDETQSQIATATNTSEHQDRRIPLFELNLENNQGLHGIAIPDIQFKAIALPPPAPIQTPAQSQSFDKSMENISVGKRMLMKNADRDDQSRRPGLETRHSSWHSSPTSSISTTPSNSSLRAAVEVEEDAGGITRRGGGGERSSLDMLLGLLEVDDHNSMRLIQALRANQGEI